MELDGLTYELEHLDLLDPARSALYADAQHNDCEHYYGKGTCGNDSYVIAQLLLSAQESNPDSDFSNCGVKISPDPNGLAARCPGFMPTLEYQQELRKGWDAAEEAHREDTRRLAQMGR